MHNYFPDDILLSNVYAEQKKGDQTDEYMIVMIGGFVISH